MPYSKKFYERTLSNKRSAEIIIPMLMDLVNPKSVIDVGCGTGVWLSVFREKGVNDIIGIDSEYLSKDDLIIPEDLFLVKNLNEPINLQRKFDLAISLEVAEHLHEKSSEMFIKSLISLSSVVLFSAAIPFQGGTYHINEQWQEYWVKIFERNGYAVFDVIRKKIWNNTDVKWWYAQNTFLFIDKENVNQFPNVLKEIYHIPYNIVHPKKYLEMNDPKKMNMLKILKAIKLLLKKN